MSAAYDYYKLIRYSINLNDVRLTSLNTKLTYGESEKIVLKIHRGVEVLDIDKAKIILDVKLEFEGEGPFEMELVIEGFCIAVEDITEQQLQEYAYEQATPLLLPYAREVVATTLTRMQLPVYNIPTMDVLRSLTANNDDLEQE